MRWTAIAYSWCQVLLAWSLALFVNCHANAAEALEKDASNRGKMTSGENTLPPGGFFDILEAQL